MSFEDRNKPCVICESTAFIWGEPASGSGVWFKTDSPVANQLGQRGSFASRFGLVARVCQNCGNVQLFMKYFPEPEKKKHG